MTDLTPGTDGLVKHISGHSGTARYQAVKVTRVTKARVFVRDVRDDHSREREFRLDNLREYGEKSWRADELIVSPAAIADTLAALEVEKARKALEGQALVALSDLRKLFEGYAVRNRSEAEIAAVVALRDRLCTPAAENAGPTG